MSHLKHDRQGKHLFSLNTRESLGEKFWEVLSIHTIFELSNLWHNIWTLWIWFPLPEKWYW